MEPGLLSNPIPKIARGFRGGPQFLVTSPPDPGFPRASLEGD